MSHKSPAIELRRKQLSKILIIAITAFLILTLLIFVSGCKKEKEQAQPLTAEETEKETVTVTTTVKEEETTAETEEEVPPEIQDLIDTANGYYSSGEYGLAKSTYRKAEIAIEDSGLSVEKQRGLIDDFYPKYNKSKEIIESARIHFANAMQLEYEQRFDEALAELEAALNLYPKYAEAIEAYENLKAMMGLE